MQLLEFPAVKRDRTNMARKPKQVVIESGVDRRDTGYYSTPLTVAQYIHSRLTSINPNGKTVADPCVGKEELLAPFLDSGFAASGVDVINHQSQYRCAFTCDDYLDIYHQFKLDSLPESLKDALYGADFWVANPPYNCHETDYIKANKPHLKALFADVGVHNMYSMFISAMLDMARPGAVLGLITLDSFLTAKFHKALRVKLLKTCKIHEILLCPTALFLSQQANVRTCILIIEKIPEDNPAVALLNRLTSVPDFYEALAQREFETQAQSAITLNSSADHYEFLIGVPADIKAVFQLQRIGERFSCITGISTGNDKLYLGSAPEPGFTVPFYKNPGTRKFYCEPDGYLIDHFVDESVTVKNFMVRNRHLMGKQGITCSSMGVEFSACYLPQNATFGVNPNIICDAQDIWWLLAYLNSDLVKYLLRGMLNRSNMVTAGYVARLPVLSFCENEKQRLESLAVALYEGAKNAALAPDKMAVLNDIVYQRAAISPQSIAMIQDFCQQIVKKA